MKPHIWLKHSWQDNGWEYQQWACAYTFEFPAYRRAYELFGLFGLGATPAAAYADWKRQIK